MKKLYVTYIQNGTLKKAEINEEKYASLRSDNTITDLILYESSLLQEQNYQAKLNGSTNSKKFLHG